MLRVRFYGIVKTRSPISRIGHRHLKLVTNINCLYHRCRQPSYSFKIGSTALKSPQSNKWSENWSGRTTRKSYEPGYAIIKRLKKVFFQFLVIVRMNHKLWLIRKLLCRRYTSSKSRLRSTKANVKRVMESAKKDSKNPPSGTGLLNRTSY